VAIGVAIGKGCVGGAESALPGEKILSVDVAVAVEITAGGDAGSIDDDQSLVTIAEPYLVEPQAMKGTPAAVVGAGCTGIGVVGTDPCRIRRVGQIEHLEPRLVPRQEQQIAVHVRMVGTVCLDTD